MERERDWRPFSFPRAISLLVDDVSPNGGEDVDEDATEGEVMGEKKEREEVEHTTFQGLSLFIKISGFGPHKEGITRHSTTALQIQNPCVSSHHLPRRMSILGYVWTLGETEGL